MNQQSNVRIVTIKDLWELFVQRRWTMLLGAAVAVTGLFLCVHLISAPQYEATATLYILRQSDEQTTGSASTDFSLALNVVNDCTYLLKSHSVVDAVIEELDLDISYEALAKRISINNPEGTRILAVTVRSDSPEQAKLIADSVCRAGTEKIAEAMGFDQVHLYEYAASSGKPRSRIGLIVYVLTGTAGAVAAYFVCLVAFLLDDRIRTKEDVERCLGLRVLGGIPDVNNTKKRRDRAYYRPEGWNGTGKKTKPDQDAVRLKTAGANDFSTQEAYKVLRTNLQFCWQDVHVAAVTSCNEREGKTTVALNLAKALSELGKQVLVIDADMRRSVMASRCAKAKDAAGLSEVLTGAKRLEECIHRTQYECLHVLFAGQCPPNPVELLNGTDFAALLAGARRYYDYIIVDTPALGQVIDAAVAAINCDGTILVLGAGSTRFDQAREAIAQLEESGSKVLGAVRNNI